MQCKNCNSVIFAFVTFAQSANNNLRKWFARKFHYNRNSLIVAFFVIFACILQVNWYICMHCIPKLVYLQHANITPCAILYIWSNLLPIGLSSCNWKTSVVSNIPENGFIIPSETWEVNSIWIKLSKWTKQNKTSWGWTGPSLAPTGSGIYFN